MTHTGTDNHSSCCSQEQQTVGRSHVAALLVQSSSIASFKQSSSPSSNILQVLVVVTCSSNLYSTRCRRGVVDRGTGPEGVMADNSLTPIDNLSFSSIWPLVMLVTPISAERENCTRTADVKLMTIDIHTSLVHTHTHTHTHSYCRLVVVLYSENYRQVPLYIKCLDQGRLAALDRWLHYTVTTIDKFHCTSNAWTRGGWLL